MNGASFAVTKDAREAVRIGGRLGREEKARANRRYRRHAKRCVQAGEDVTPKLWTGWDVV